MKNIIIFIIGFISGLLTCVVLLFIEICKTLKLNKTSIQKFLWLIKEGLK